jgi:hypothetical protein
MEEVTCQEPPDIVTPCRKKARQLGLWANDLDKNPNVPAIVSALHTALVQTALTPRVGDLSQVTETQVKEHCGKHCKKPQS